MKKVFFTTAIVVGLGMPGVFAQEQASAPSAEQVTTQPAVVAPTPMTENADPWQVSVEGGGLWSEKSDDRLHRGEEITGRLTYDVTPNVAIGAESGGLRFEDELNGTRYGHLDGVPAMVDLVFKMPIAAIGNHLVPYVYGAGGTVIWSYEKSDYSDDTGVDARTRAHWAAKPGAGLEYYLTPHVSLFIEGSYLFSQKYHIKGGTSSPPDGEVNVNSVYGGGGIKLAF